MRKVSLAPYGCVVAALLLFGCGPGQIVGPPGNTDAWLSYKYSQSCGSYPGTTACGLTDTGEADGYYQAIGAKDSNGNALFNLTQWKQAYGYPGVAGTPSRALYANKLDLQIGRDMNCWQYGQDGQNVACYVTNYGPIPYTPSGNIYQRLNLSWPNLVQAVDDAINQNSPFATVAMAYSLSGIGSNQDPVAFFVFDQNGNLSDEATLDHEGPKTVPRMCMACHGGTYSTTNHSVQGPKAGQLGTSFLPFDVWSFYYSTDIPGYDRTTQQESFRELNALVLATNPSPAIQGLINDLYANVTAQKVTAKGATIPDDSYVPAAWQTQDGSGQKIYKGVFRQYCRMCHLAEDPPADFSTFAGFQQLVPSISALVCGTSSDMPHAEIPYGGLTTTVINAASVAQFDEVKTTPGEGVGFWWDVTALNDLNSLLQPQLGSSSGCPLNFQ